MPNHSQITTKSIKHACVLVTGNTRTYSPQHKTSRKRIDVVASFVRRTLHGLQHSATLQLTARALLNTRETHFHIISSPTKYTTISKIHAIHFTDYQQHSWPAAIEVVLIVTSSPVGPMLVLEWVIEKHPRTRWKFNSFNWKWLSVGGNVKVV